MSTTRQPSLDPDLLDKVYTSYLSLLSLRPVHVEAYRARGWVDFEVAREHGYVSLPFGYLEARRVTNTLMDRFGIEIMRRVPGYYADKNGIVPSAVQLALQERDHAFVGQRVLVQEAVPALEQLHPGAGDLA